MDFSFAILFYDPRFIVAEEDKAQGGYEEQRLNRFDFRSSDLARDVAGKLRCPQWQSQHHFYFYCTYGAAEAAPFQNKIKTRVFPQAMTAAPSKRNQDQSC
jgi:hypothetical protein